MLKRGTEQRVTGMLPTVLPECLERSEGQEQMYGFAGHGGKEVKRERKQNKGNKI